MDEEQLMTRAACGDVAAFGMVVKANQGRLQRFARQMLGGDREAASDVVQEAFVRVWQARASYTPSGSGRLTPFLLRVVRNGCLDSLRARRRWEDVQIDEDVPVAGPSCEASALSAALRDAVEQVLRRLPETQRAVFVLSEYEGLSYHEIAEVVGCPYGTVASRKHAAMGALRAELRPWWEGEER